MSNGSNREGTMKNEFMLIFGCGVLALIYGGLTVRQILSMSAGTPRMQKIDAAIQEGAKAYLNRQYTPIGIVGLVVGIALGLLLGRYVAIGFFIGAILS